MKWLALTAVLMLADPAVADTPLNEELSQEPLSAELGAVGPEQQNRLRRHRDQAGAQGPIVEEATHLSTWASRSQLGPPATLFTGGDELWVNSTFKAGGGGLLGIGVVYAIGQGLMGPPLFATGSFAPGQNAYLTTAWKVSSVPFCVQAIGIHVLVEGGAPQFSVTSPFTVCP